MEFGQKPNQPMAKIKKLRLWYQMGRTKFPHTNYPKYMEYKVNNLGWNNNILNKSIKIWMR